MITRDPQVKAIFFNIFGGITRCDEVARGILQALSEMGLELPIVVRLDGTNAAEGRQILADAAPANLHVSPTMLEAAKLRRGAGGMTDVWSDRAEQYRTSDAHREGPDLDLVVEWAAGAAHGPRRRDRRRPRRAPPPRGGARGRQQRSRRPGCSPTSSAGPRIFRSPTAASTSSSRRVAAHHFDDVAQAVAEMARVAATRVLIVDNAFMGEDVEEAEKLRDPSHVRNYSEAEWRVVRRGGGPRASSRGAHLREADRAAAVARPLRLRGRGCRARDASCWATGSRTGRVTLDRIALNAVKGAA